MVFTDLGEPGHASLSDLNLLPVAVWLFVCHECVQIRNYVQIGCVSGLLRLGLCLCPCAHSCLFVHLYLHAETIAPLHSICMCRVLWDVGSALPCRQLNFSPCCVLHYPTLHESVHVHSLLLPLPLPLYSSSSPVIVLPHRNHYLPLTTHTPNQSKELSRLALEKTP